jgi:recombination protein RecA
MPSAATIRSQVEAALAGRIPSALRVVPREIRPVESTGIPSVDEMLDGGLPLGAITEIVGPDCSGRTSFALSFLSGMTQAGKVCAWIDVSNALQPESAAAAGVDLSRMLWVRCGVGKSNSQHVPQQRFVLPEKYLVPPPIKQGLHGGGFGGHPRGEIKGLSEAMTELLHPLATAPGCAEPLSRVQTTKLPVEPISLPIVSGMQRPVHAAKPWSRIDQALRVADLLLQGGGFSAIVLDMAGIAPEFSSRVPLATWFRYRAAAERTQASVLLLTQYACAKSSAALVLQLRPGEVMDGQTVFNGVEHQIEVVRHRFNQATTNVISLRKPPQRACIASWRSTTVWTGRG